MKNLALTTGTAAIAVLGFFQMELNTIDEELKEVKADVVKTQERLRYSSADEDCLAKNIFYEAGVEPLIGKFAVAQVTLNRLEKGRWGNNLCKVVYAPRQFSWTLDPDRRHQKPRGTQWEDSRFVARAVLSQGYRVYHLEDSTHYHADYIEKPLWARTAIRVLHLGQHVFYRNPG